MKNTYIMRLFDGLHHAVFTVEDDFISCKSTLGGFNFFWDIDFKNRDHFKTFIRSLNDSDIPNIEPFVTISNESLELMIKDNEIDDDELIEKQYDGTIIGNHEGNIHFFDEYKIDIPSFLLDIFIDNLQDYENQKYEEFVA